jgi:hypothetical protein
MTNISEPARPSEVNGPRELHEQLPDTLRRVKRGNGRKRPILHHKFWLRKFTISK